MIRPGGRSGRPADRPPGRGQGLGEASTTGHVAFTSPSSGPGSVGDMKMQLAALFGMAAYLVLCSSFAGVLAGVLPTPGT